VNKAKLEMPKTSQHICQAVTWETGENR